MKGCRPLSNQEIIKVKEQFTGTFSTRNRSLFMLGVSVGGRISELLSLVIEDAWQNGQPISDLLFSKGKVKGKSESRMIPCNSDAKEAIRELVVWHKQRYGDLDKKRPLFPSRKSGSLSRSQAHRILAKAFSSAGLNGKLATHTMRKTFAQRVYDASGDIYLVKELLGHKSVDTTRQYLGVSYKKMQEATEEIEICNRTPILLHSADNISDEKLIVELQALLY